MPPFSDDQLVLLDRVARRYGVDPWVVLSWTPARLGLARECVDAYEALMARRCQGLEHGVQAVVVMGGL